jgi:nitroreductase
MVLDAIKNRWSAFSFSEKPVEEEKLREMFEAASLAPSSMNEQPWIFIIASKNDPSRFNDFTGFLEESNSVWAKNAWALIVSLARTKFVYKDRPNKYAFHDTGLAVSNMLTQAMSLNICSHVMGGFYSERVKEYFRLPDGIEPVSVIAVGYPGDGSGLNEVLKKRNATRKPRKKISEFVFRSSFNNPAF